MRKTEKFLRGGPDQGWTDKLKRANPLRALRILIPSESKLGKPLQRNLIALVGVNTIMFGGFMGGMNVMMLYSQVSHPSTRSTSHYLSKLYNSTHSDGVIKNPASSSRLSTSSAQSPPSSSSPSPSDFSVAGYPQRDKEPTPVALTVSTSFSSASP